MDEHALFAGPGEDEADLFGQNLEDEMMEEEEGEDMDEDMEDMDEEPAREGRGWGAGGAGARGLREAGPSAPEVAEEEVMDVRAILEETERRPGNTALHLLSHMRLASAVSDSEEEEEAEDEDLQPGPSRQRKGKRVAQLFGPGVDDIWDSDMARRIGLVDGRRRRRGNRGRKASRQSQLQVEADRIIGDATKLYIDGHFEAAMKRGQEALRLLPDEPGPYNLLAVVHELMGNKKKAFDFYTLAALLGPQDTDRWKRLAHMARELGSVQQAVVCLDKVLARDKEDIEARVMRAQLLVETRDFRRAVKQYEYLLATDTDMPKGDFLNMLARLHHRMGNSIKAIEIVEKYIADHPNAGLTQINILAELYITQGLYNDGLFLLDKAKGQMCNGGPLPADLAVRAGICHAYLGNKAKAMAHFHVVASLPDSAVGTYGDLFLEVGETLLAVGMPAEAAGFYQRIHAVSKLDSTTVRAKLAECYVTCGQHQEAIPLLESVIGELEEGTEDHEDAVLQLCSMYAETGTHTDRGVATLDALKVPTFETLLSEGMSQNAHLEGARPTDLNQLQKAARARAKSVALRKAQLYLRLGDRRKFRETIRGSVGVALSQLVEDPDSVIREGQEDGATAEAIRNEMREALLARNIGDERVTKAAMSRLNLLLKGRFKTLSPELVRGYNNLVNETRTPPESQERPAPGILAVPEPDTRSAYRTRQHIRDAEAIVLSVLERQDPNRLRALHRISGRRQPHSDDADGMEVDEGGVAPEWAPQHLVQDNQDFLALVSVLDSLISVGELGDVERYLRGIHAVLQRCKATVPKRLAIQLCEARLRLMQGRPEEAQRLLRGMLTRRTASRLLWTAACEVAHCAGEAHRWLPIGLARPKGTLAAWRQGTGDSGNVAPVLYMGHFFLGQSSKDAMAHALTEYFQALAMSPKDPLVLMCIGVAMCNWVCGKGIPDRDKGALHTFGWLDLYASAKQEEAEALYNMGRAAHQMGLLSAAAMFYKRSLTAASKAPAFGRGVEREAAFNLSLIFRHSGADELVRALLRKYCTF